MDSVGRIPVNPSQSVHEVELVGGSEWNWRSSLLDIPLLMRSFGVANWEIVVIEGPLRQVLSSPLIYLGASSPLGISIPPWCYRGCFLLGSDFLSILKNF